MNRRSLVLLSLWVVLLVASGLYFAGNPGDMHRRVLWFPDATATSVQAEWRFVPDRDTPQESIRVFVEELLLGPVRLGSVAFVQPGTRLRSVVLDDNRRLFLDLAGENLVNLDETGRSVEEVIQLLQQNLMHNFRLLRDVQITVDGQVPGAPFFRSSAI